MNLRPCVRMHSSFSHFGVMRMMLHTVEGGQVKPGSSHVATAFLYLQKV